MTSKISAAIETEASLQSIFVIHAPYGNIYVTIVN